MLKGSELSGATTGAKAVAAPGGFMQRKNCISKIEPPTAEAAASEGSCMLMVQLTPTNAEIRCPPVNDQQVAKGLCGVKNKITADAPIEQTNMGNWGKGVSVAVINETA